MQDLQARRRKRAALSTWRTRGRKACLGPAGQSRTPSSNHAAPRLPECGKRVLSSDDAQYGAEEPSSGCNVIPRRVRPGLADQGLIRLIAERLGLVLLASGLGAGGGSGPSGSISNVFLRSFRLPGRGFEV